jgi:TetR/AcrR family transcriptional regulator, transcriptional repressor for nem operon
MVYNFMSVTETREKLLATALELIWQSNYNCVGVNDICRQAGVTKGAFYHHFDSKASLFCEAASYYWQVIKTDLDAVFSPINSPLQQLENLIEFVFKSKISTRNKPIPGCPFFNAGAQIGTDDEQVLEALRSLSQTAINYDIALVKALASAGYLNYKADPDSLGRMMYTYIHGVMSFAHLQTDISTVRKDLPEGLYRLLGIKEEYWFTESATWNKQPLLAK